ncbi:MAG: hypothetical protein GY906_08755 [bacterium]|nr:hypothetical protein [bacterium]
MVKLRLVQRENQRGSALVLALMAAALVAMAVLLTASYQQIHSNAHTHEMRNIELTALADAALAEAMAKLAEDPKFDGAPRHVFGAGEIGSSISQLPDNWIRIRAVAVMGNWRATITADAKVSLSGASLVRWRYRQGPN